MRRAAALFILMTALASLALAACSGGGGGSKTPSGSGDSGAATVSPELQSVRNKFNDSTFKGTYKLSASTSADDGLGNGTMVIYKDGADRFRFDVTTQQNGQDSKVIFIQSPAAQAFCLDNAGDLGAIFGVDTNQGVCFKSDPESGDNPLSGLSGTFSDVAADGEVLEKSNRSIAGRDATCYRVKTSDNSGDTTSQSCFDDQGVLLYSKTEGTDESEIEATDISGSVADTDFNLPYEERAFPTVTDDTPTP